MKYVICQADLADLKAKVQSWLRTIYNHKHYHKTKKRVTSYLNLCNQFYLEPITLNKLVKKHFHSTRNTFYQWANKILTAYQNDDFNSLIFKYKKPNKISY
ncbi:hypothetical protein [Spiroplasma endosymbiont of Clivina fossor]